VYYFNGCKDNPKKRYRAVNYDLSTEKYDFRIDLSQSVLFSAKKREKFVVSGKTSYICNSYMNNNLQE